MRGVLSQTEHLRDELQEYGGGLRGHLRVFANTTAVTDFLPEILPAFLAANPRMNVDLQEKPNAEIARGVLEGRADIGIVAGEVDTLGLQAIHFSTDRLVLATARKHRFASRSPSPSPRRWTKTVGMQQGSTLQSSWRRSPTPRQAPEAAHPARQLRRHVPDDRRRRGHRHRARTAVRRNRRAWGWR